MSWPCPADDGDKCGALARHAHNGAALCVTEGKYFYPTRAQAENLGAQYAKLGLGEQTLTSGQICRCHL